MAPRTDFHVPAIVAGTPYTRAYRVAFPFATFPWRHSLEFYNHSSGAVLTIIVNGSDEIPLAPGDSVLVDWIDKIYAWTVDASANTSDGDVVVYEAGGLDAP